MGYPFGEHHGGRYRRLGGGPKWCVGNAQGVSCRTAPRSTPRSSIPHSNELVAAVTADLETEGGQSKLQKALHRRFAEVTNPADFVQHSLITLREASAILDAREPADAAAFKAWLFGVSQKVAEAASEGGFLGFGGVQVSDAERATLDDIAKALGIAAPQRRAQSSSRTPLDVVDDPPVRERVVGNP